MGYIATTGHLNADDHPKWTYLSSFFAPTSTNSYGREDIYLCDLMFMNYIRQIFSEILERPQIILYGGKKEFEVQLQKLPALSIHQNNLAYDGESYPVGAAQLIFTPVKFRVRTGSYVHEETGGVRLLPFKATYTVKLWTETIERRNRYIRHAASRFMHQMVDRYYSDFIEFYNGHDEQWEPYSIYVKLTNHSHPLQYNMSGDDDNRWKIMQALTFDVYYHAYEFQMPTTYIVEAVKYAIHEETPDDSELYFVVNNDEFMTAAELDRYLTNFLNELMQEEAQ